MLLGSNDRARGSQMPHAMVVVDGRMRLREVPSIPLAPDQVRIDVAAAGVNPVDGGNASDPSWAGIEDEYVVGYECAGEVLEVGGAVSGIEAGDAVWACLPVRGTRWGTYATELVADARYVGIRPTSLDAPTAAATPLPGVTALQVLDRLAPRTGEWVLVHGASGGVGHLFVQLARHRGAHVAALARAHHHEWLRELGAEVVIDRLQPEPIAQARRASGEDFAMVADFVGQSLVVDSLGVVAERGRIASIVALAGDFDEALDKNITLHGVLLDPNHADLDRLAALVNEGRLTPRLGEVLPLSEAERAQERLGSGVVAGRIALASQ
jgi:NADPH:quinone reductase